MKYFKSFVVLCLCCLFLIPDRVHADSQTYWVVPKTEQEGIIGEVSSTYLYQSSGTGEIRGVIENNIYTDIKRLYLVSNISGNEVYYHYDNSSATSSFNSYRNYYISYSGSTSAQVNVVNAMVSNNYPIINVYSFNEDDAIYYTWGDGAIGPVEPVNYGDLLDVKFSTSIAGQGSAAINNIDHITWNPEMDSNGIKFDGTERVQIKAIAGNYTDSSRNGLLGLGVTDFDYNSGSEHMLAEYPATRGYYDVSWSHVIQQLNAGSISDFLNIRKNDDVWLKSGWIYQIRLISGDYVGQWITIYNATSSGVQNSLNVENSTELNMTLVNTIQQINNLNQNVTNWQIDNTIINMENQDGTETTDKPWWAYLLEAIVSFLNGILGFLGNLIGDLIDAIVSLFQPDEFTINNFNEYKLELKQNSGIFGQAIDFTNTLKNTFLGVQYQDPVLHWQGISFGETVFIPAADYNLNDYVTMWGLGDFRTMAYLCSDGFIYFSLLVLIVRKLNEVLKK